MTIPGTESNPGDYLVSWNGHGDALGLWAINPTDGTLTLANSFTYTTWGAASVATHNGYPDLGFRFRYVGEFDVQWDDVHGLGLYYMHARHYSPSLGRFLQPDPDRSEANLYAYAADNPVTEIDPDGNCFILCAVANAVLDTAIYLATTDRSKWSLQGAATAAATGAVTGFLGVGLLSKVTKVGALARAASKVFTKVPKASRAVKRVVNRPRPRAATSCALHSFDADTPVNLADGSRVPIDELAVGDEVLAWDEASGTTGAYPITHVWAHDDPVTGYVVIDGEAIATTPGHPFYTTERGWVEASDLQVGEHVPSVTSGTGVVAGVSWLRGADRMYDLTVAIAHTFFVGDGGWLVHNRGCGPIRRTTHGIKLHADPRAGGRPHTVFRRDETDRVTNYSTFGRRNPHGHQPEEIRFRGFGRKHGGVRPPLVLTPKKRLGTRPVVARPPHPWELPRGY